MGCVPADRKAVVLKLSIRLASWRVASCLPVSDQICHRCSRRRRHEFAHMAVNSKVMADTEFKIGPQLASHSLTSRENRCVEQWFAQRSRRTRLGLRRGYRSAIKARSDSLHEIMLDTAHWQARSPTESSQFDNSPVPACELFRGEIRFKRWSNRRVSHNRLGPTRRSTYETRGQMFQSGSSESG